MCVMKKIFVVIAMIWLADTLSAQTTAEWLSQKKTQKKYLAQQIAALHVYATYVSKGYSIVKSGLHTIQNIKDGDLHIHADHFASLLTVNPKIKHYAKVADILSMEINIVKQTGGAIKRFYKSKQFTGEELAYLKDVSNNILQACTNNLDHLGNIITNGDLQMKDDARIQAIDKVYADMQDIQVFTASFCNSATGLSVERNQEENDIIVAKKLNGLK